MGKLLVSAMNAAPELAGCGKYTGELVFEMARRGHAVEVVTPAPHYPGRKGLGPGARAVSDQTDTPSLRGAQRRSNPGAA
ncbi:MAG: hypothetical protein ACLPN5_01165 [Roseiarcus sp.]